MQRFARLESFLSFLGAFILVGGQVAINMSAHLQLTTREVDSLRRTEPHLFYERLVTEDGKWDPHTQCYDILQRVPQLSFMASLDGMAEERTLLEHTLHHRTHLVKAPEMWLCGNKPCNISRTTSTPVSISRPGSEANCIKRFPGTSHFSTR